MTVKELAAHLASLPAELQGLPVVYHDESTDVFIEGTMRTIAYQKKGEQVSVVQLIDWQHTALATEG